MVHDETILRQLSAYVDGELDGESVRWLEEQLAASPSLRRELAQLRRLSSMLQSAPPQQLSQGQMTRLHLAVGQVHQSMVYRIARHAAAVAAVVLIGCGLGLAWVNRAQPYGEDRLLDSIVSAVHRNDDVADEQSDADAEIATWVVMALSEPRP